MRTSDLNRDVIRGHYHACEPHSRLTWNRGSDAPIGPEFHFSALILELRRREARLANLDLTLANDGELTKSLVRPVWTAAPSAKSLFQYPVQVGKVGLE